MIQRISTLLFIAFFLLYPPFILYAAEDARQAGTNQGNAAIDKYGSKENFKGNIVNPQLNSNTPMNTIDNSTSFNAQLICPSSNSFLEVFVQPASSGDLGVVIIRQDMDLDGNPDYSYQVPVTVSGVCANGVISCDSGTWNNCKYYAWTSDDNNNVSIKKVDITELGGCYCINNACGNNLVWQNIGVVLRSLGGGAAGSVMVKNPVYAISDIKIKDNTTISYYGQKSKGCSTAPSSGSDSPSKYYKNYAAVSGDLETEISNQKKDPKSYYSLITNSLIAQKNMTEYNDCKINKVLSCVPNSTDYVVDAVNLCSELEADPKCKLKEETVDDVYTYRSYNPTGLTPLDSCQSITCQREADCNNNTLYTDGGWGSGCIGGFPDAITSDGLPAKMVCLLWDEYGVCKQWEEEVDSDYLNNPRSSYTSFVPAGNAFTPSVRLESSSGRGQCSGNYLITIFNADGTPLSTKNGTVGCGDYTIPLVYIPAKDGYYTAKIWMYSHAMYGSENCWTEFKRISCPLDEKIQCVGDINTSVCAQQATHNVCTWWNKQRSYLCDTGEKYDFSDVQKRASCVKTSTTDNVNSFSYQDCTKNSDGTWTTTNYNTNLPQRDAKSSCEKACKSRKLKPDARVSATGTASQYQNNPNSYDTFYKTCWDDTCPVEAGEEIIKNCQCLNEFGEAAAIMQALRKAGQEFICSDGVPKDIK